MVVDVIARVQDLVIDCVILGKFKPSEHISEAFLEREFHIGRGHAREVLWYLVAQGYLERRYDQGCFVPCVSPEKVKSFFQTRLLLESDALTRIITSNAKLNPIAILIKEGGLQVINQNNPDFYLIYAVKKNILFHKGLMQCAGYDMSADFVGSLVWRSFVNVFGQEYLKCFDMVSANHAELFYALQEVNLQKAQHVLVKSFSWQEQWLLSFVPPKSNLGLFVSGT